MVPERRRSPRVEVDGDGTGGVVKGLCAVAVRDLSAGGLRLSLGEALEPGGVYPLTLFLRGLSLAAPVRVTRCRPDDPASLRRGAGGRSFEAAAEFLWRDAADAAVVRSWLLGQAPRPV